MMLGRRSGPGNIRGAGDAERRGRSGSARCERRQRLEQQPGERAESDRESFSNRFFANHRHARNYISRFLRCKDGIDRRRRGNASARSLAMHQFMRQGDDPARSYLRGVYARGSARATTASTSSIVRAGPPPPTLIKEKKFESRRRLVSATAAMKAAGQSHSRRACERRRRRLLWASAPTGLKR